MPHIWINKQGEKVPVVLPDELVPLYKTSYKALDREIQRYKDVPYGIKRAQQGGNGRRLLIDFDSLPKNIQEALGDPRQASHLMEYFYSVDEAAVRFYGDYQFEDGGYLSLEHQREYITNASVLQAAKKLKTARERERRSKGSHLKYIMDSVRKDVAGFNHTLQVKHNVKHTLPESERRFKEVFRKFFKPTDEHTCNYKSLISGKLCNQNSRKVDDGVMQLLNDLFAGQGNKPTRTEVSRVYDGFLQGYVSVIKSDGSGEMYDPKEYKPLSEATIINYLGMWDERIGTYAKRSGDRQQLMAQFKPYHSLKRPEYAGSIISVDDRQPPFEYAPGERMWFYNGIDLGSEAFTCWVWGKSKEGIITDFYRQLVRNYTQWGFNLPLEIEAELSLNNSFTNSFLRPGVMFDHVRIEANNARGKRIERYFKSLRYGNEKERDGWLARPFAKTEANQAGPGAKKIIPYNNIVENSLRDIQEWNNSPHSVHTHMSRWDVFCEMQHPDTKPTNWKGILPTLGYATATSVKTGIIKLQGGEYLLGDDGQIYTGEKLINLMKRVEGENVTVYWLDDNEGNVLKAIVYLGTTCICEALPKPMYSRATAERTPEDEQARQIMSAYVATIDGYMNRKRTSINDVLVIDNRPKTISNRFVIPGLTQYVPSDTEPEIMPDIEDNALPIPMPNKTYRKSLKDRI
jgi:hypothetical protein